MEEVIRDNSEKESNNEPVRLPSYKEFVKLIEGDTPLRAASCQMNYTVYHKYSDGGAW